jgi:hypothetical protein
MNSTTIEPNPVEIETGFLRALQLFNHGEKLHEASAALRKVNEAVNAHGKAGSVTVKLTIQPSGNAIQFTAEVDYRIPKQKPQPAIFFLDDCFNLTRSNPDQKELELRVAAEAPQEPGEARKVVAT